MGARLMRRTRNDAIARSFSNLDFHDDALVSVTMQAPRRKHDSAKVDFEFRDDSARARKLLSISGCANLRWRMDFDVLADNWFAQTQGVTSQVDLSRMKGFVLAQMHYWHTKYMPPTPKDKPIRKKLSSIRRYRLFKLTFYGGTIEVLARNFKLKTIGRGSRTPRAARRPTTH